MDKTFFKSEGYIDFLRSRFAYLKATRHGFSARSFAKRAQIGSPSYFQLVITGRRKLSLEYAKKFAKGLGLDDHETACLLKSVELERAIDPEERERYRHELERLAHKERASQEMVPVQVEILADPINLKLYLLAQSHRFQLKVSWINRHLGSKLSFRELEGRIDLLFRSGLWQRHEGKTKTLAPLIKTGDGLTHTHILKTHDNLLNEARRAVREKNASQRIVGGRTFLCKPQDIAKAAERIEAFKSSLEAEFEDRSSTTPFQLHVSFFELDPEKEIP